MKTILNKKIAILLTMVVGFAFVISFAGCKASAEIASKSGAQLWGENCRRCHNAPDPSTHSDENWVTVGMHMQTRALLTNTERDKIVAFLQGK